MTELLITVDDAVMHLGVTDQTQYVHIEMKAYIASQLVMDYMKLTAIPDEWYSDASPPELQVPRSVQGVTLAMVGELYYNREASSMDVLPERLQVLLPRDPSFA